MYPYNQVNWNENDQRYWFKMVRLYRYNVNLVKEPFRYLIAENKDAVWEQEYQEYLASQSI